MNLGKTSLRIRGVANLKEILIVGGEVAVKHAGEKIPPETDHLKVGEWPTSVAAIDCPLDEKADVNDHLTWACELLRKNRNTFEKLTASGGEIDLYCALELSQPVSSCAISSPLLRCLGEFKVSLFFRIIYDEVFAA